MATILAVDLAARYSAACLMNEDYRILTQFDSWQASEDTFISTLVSPWNYAEDFHPPQVMVIEDLPHGLNYSGIVKQVCRLQGRIAHAMHTTTGGDLAGVLFVAPRVWRAHYKLKRGTGPDAVFGACRELGYSAPDLTERAKGNGGRTRMAKVQSDYCAAYLIARWAVDTKAAHGTYDVPGTSRYNTREIRQAKDVAV